MSETVPAGHGGCLADTTGNEFLVGLVVHVDVEIARGLVLGCDGVKRSERRAVEEGHFYVSREGVVTREPTLALEPPQKEEFHLTALQGHRPHHHAPECDAGYRDGQDHRPYSPP